MKTHYTIPFFIPHEGCPFDCIFCDQKKISGSAKSPSARDITSTIKKYLKTIPGHGVTVEAGFFGGSFTGLPLQKQEAYLKTVQSFIKNGRIKSIRLSTRPDFIDQNILSILKKYKVKTIELGVQSMSDDVLQASRRGHTKKDVVASSKLILKNGFRLGHQLMVGLPKSTLQKELNSAKASIKLGAKDIRIYPVVVIIGTHLEHLWKNGKYKVLTEAATIGRCAELLKIFNKKNVEVIRLGLHPSKDLASGQTIAAGPFHPAFRQKVLTYIFRQKLDALLSKIKNKKDISNICYNPHDTAYAIGYGRSNAEYVEKMLGRRGVMKADGTVHAGELAICRGDS